MIERRPILDYGTPQPKSQRVVYVSQFFLIAMAIMYLVVFAVVWLIPLLFGAP